ncbi:MAG: hypothetical protein L0Y66_23120, partial [Myxococcaceae bacterium]|nr:hypothetical protein [Myxococcaceae bacterium]
WNYNRNQAAAEVAAGGSVLNYDGSEDWTWASRRTAKKGVDISRIFREVFGDEAMMTRVRPVLMTQQDDGNATLSQAIKLLHGYYNNGEGNYVSDPRPPSHYFYGAGGSAYYWPDIASPSLTLDSIWTSQTMSADAWLQGVLLRDSDIVAAAGLKRVAYEGGPSFDRTGNSEAVKAQAVDDPRMRTSVVEHHRVWTAAGGELLVYFTLAGDYRWGFSPDVLQTSSQKLQALEDVRAMAPVAVTHGTAIPGARAGAAWGMNAQGWGAPGTGSRTFASGVGQFSWATYTFRAEVASTRTVHLEVGSASAGTEVAVYVNGVLQGRQPLPSGTANVSFPGAAVSPGLNGVIVRAVTGSFVLNQVRVE